MADEFSYSVEYGLRLSKRIYYGKDRSVSPPVPETMSKSSSSLPEKYVPTAPMVYAVIQDPEIVDNPDVTSYQPYVHGRCDPPALIPLHMHGMSMEVDCYIDTAFVTVTGTWRVHCVMGSKRCDCRIAIPMGEQGSVLGVEVDVMGRSYHTQLIRVEEKDGEKGIRTEDWNFLKGKICTLKVPQVDGGSKLTVKMRWSQNLFYLDGHFSLIVPFNFPPYVMPAENEISRREKIQLNVNCGTLKEILCKTTSHPLKELRRQAGRLGFLYEAEVQTWSNADFSFSYTVSSSEISGNLLLQSPPLLDFSRREMFCLYLYPGNNHRRKVFRREVIFVIDISGSMRGGPLEIAKNALLEALSNLNPGDSFNIIAFNESTHLFSSSMELVTEEATITATHWVDSKFIAEGGTNILLPLNQAMEMLSKANSSIPLIFLITDGSVEDERHICNVVKDHLRNGGSISPRIFTFGIGSYCNHYFLKMLAQIGRGRYDASYDADSLDFRMRRLFTSASSIILANINIDSLEHFDSLELYPISIPDLSSESPVIISGRYHGIFPDTVKISGILADMSSFTTELTVQKAKNVPLDKVFARRQIDLLTAGAWMSERKDLEEKVANMSIQTDVPSEYTRMILLWSDKGKPTIDTILTLEVYNNGDLVKSQKIILLHRLGVGFGNRIATAENIPPGTEKVKSSEPTEFLVRAASNCCGTLLDRFCCMCFIRCCSKLNNQCTIVLTQLCAALSCFECLSCCCDLCNCL